MEELQTDNLALYILMMQIKIDTLVHTMDIAVEELGRIMSSKGDHKTARKALYEISEAIANANMLLAYMNEDKNEAVIQ